MVQDEIVVLELVHENVEMRGCMMQNGERRSISMTSLFFSVMVFDGVVEDGVIQDVEDIVDVVVDLEDGTAVVKLWEAEVDEDKWEVVVIELLEDDVEVVDVLEDVTDVYEIGHLT